MTVKKAERPDTVCSGAGLSKSVQQGNAEQRLQDSGNLASPQGGRPLYFEPVCRQEAVRTAEAFNDAAARLKAAALSNAGNLGRSLDALAGHYAKRAASYFMAADTLPEVRA